jgi:hypothetical protein
MTHAATANAALFYLLVFLTLLLMMFIIAVVLAPAAPPGSPSPPVREAPTALAVQAPTPPPRQRPLDTAPAAGAAGWSADADAASGARVPVPAYDRVQPPTVSGGPPWRPAPKPAGPDPWAADNPSPGGLRWPDEGSVSPGARRPTSLNPEPGTPVPAGSQARYPRHAREGLPVAAGHAGQPRPQWRLARAGRHDRQPARSRLAALADEHRNGRLPPPATILMPPARSSPQTGRAARSSWTRQPRCRQ